MALEQVDSAGRNRRERPRMSDITRSVDKAEANYGTTSIRSGDEMREPTYLEIRGAKHMLNRALDYVHMKTRAWEPRWSYSDPDKYCKPDSTEDAIVILRKAVRECSSS
jgi:hypothetical protein